MTSSRYDDDFDGEEYVGEYDSVDEDYDSDEEQNSDDDYTVLCPSCKADVYEDAERCPNCGAYITYSTSLWSGRSLVWIVLGLLGILAVIYVLVGVF
jgi:hypothetical protein